MFTVTTLRRLSEVAFPPNIHSLHNPHTTSTIPTISTSLNLPQPPSTSLNLPLQPSIVHLSTDSVQRVIKFSSEFPKMTTIVNTLGNIFLNAVSRLATIGPKTPMQCPASRPDDDRKAEMNRGKYREHWYSGIHVATLTMKTIR
jgi:hypothetical protein